MSIKKIIIIILTVLYGNVFGQSDTTAAYQGTMKDPERIAEGRQLFGAHCAQCHAICNEVIGPALASVHATRPLPWLVNFIQNSQAVIQSGDEYAVFIYNQYNRSVMPAMEFLTENEIRSILAYIQYESSPTTARGGVTSSSQDNYFEEPDAEYLPPDNLTSRHGEDDASKEMRTSKKVTFLTLAIATLVGITVLFAYFARKFR